MTPSRRVTAPTQEAVRACLPSDVGLVFADDAEQWLKNACEAYFAHFDAPRIADRTSNIMVSSWECSCGRPLGGFVGTFTWGICHGEGFCGNCRRPGRAVHRLIDPRDGTEFASLGPIMLLYRLLDEERAE